MYRPFVRILQALFIAAAASMAYSYVSAAKDGELVTRCTTLCTMHPDYAGDDRRAPDIALRDLDGVTRHLSELRGKVVVLVFWTSTCQACKKQMPSLARLSERLRDSDRFAIFTVAADSSAEKVEQAMLKATGKKRPFPVVLDGDSSVILDKFGTKLFPETWILDRDGIIRARFDGARDWSSSIAMGILEQVWQGANCPVRIRANLIEGEGAATCRSVMR